MRAYWAIAPLTLVLTAAISPPAAEAQTKQQIRWCEHKDGVTADLPIGSCTALIRSGRFSGNNLAVIFDNRGNAYTLKHDYNRAIADYNQAIRLNPRNAKAYHNRGYSYDQKKEYDRAIADYNQAIRLNPRYASAFINRAISYYSKGKYDRAIADYSQAIALKSGTAKTFYNRALAYTQKHDYDRAISDFNRAIKLNPYYTRALHRRAEAHLFKRDYDSAIADYGQWIRIDPKSAIAFNYRGDVYTLKNDYDRAIRDYNQAIKLNSRFANTYAKRGSAYAAKGQNDRAAADFRAALKLDPKLTWAQDRLSHLSVSRPSSKTAPPAPRAVAKASVPRMDGFAAEVLAMVEATRGYKILSSYDGKKKKSDPAWPSSAQGRAVNAYLVAFRSDAAAARIVDTAKARYLEFSVGGKKIIDKEICAGRPEIRPRLSRLRREFNRAANRFGQNLKTFLATLGKGAGLKQ